MKLSLNWLKEFIEINDSPDKIADILTKLGLEVEEIIDNSKKYSGFYVAEVIEKKDHPNADRLSVCQVKLSDDDVRTVICGAPNVDEKQKIILGTSGAIVPSAGFELEKRKIRGIESNGMICSQAELELGEDHSGIWILPNDAQIGQSLSEYMELDDVVLDIAVTPNKGDCLSHFGIARDLAAYYEKTVKLDDISLSESGENIDDVFNVEIQESNACPRYAVKIVKDVTVKESPDWLKKKLTAVGLRPINNIVDVTNLILMEIGQPLHAFDLDKINGNKIIVKNADDGDTFKTLDGKNRKLDENMLMICDEKIPVAVAGVMGGSNSEIDENSKNVLIESAFFNPSSVRRTAKKLGITSDSSYRFERGVDIDLVPYAAEKAANLIHELGGGEILEGILDVYANKKENIEVHLRYERVRKILGIDISDTGIKKILNNLNFKTLEENDGGALFHIPNYRHDIEQEIDLIEEVIRIYNYDNLKPQFYAEVSFDARKTPDHLSEPKLRKEIRDYFINRGFNESKTLNQVSPKSSEFFTDNPVRVANPLGEDLSVMRPSLLPSSLKVIERNIRLGSKDLRIFEIGKIFITDDEGNSLVKGVDESENILILLTGQRNIQNLNNNNEEVDFYDIKGIFEDFSKFFKLNELKLKTNETEKGFTGNSINIYHKTNKIGTFGQVDNNLLKVNDIEQEVFGLNINLSYLYRLPAAKSVYSPVSQYPTVVRDLAFLFDKEIEAGKLLNIIEQNGGKYLVSSEIFDIYEGDNIEEGKKSVAYRLKFNSNTRTLREEEIEEVTKKLIKKIESDFNAYLRR